MGKLWTVVDGTGGELANAGGNVAEEERLEIEGWLKEGVTVSVEGKDIPIDRCVRYIAPPVMRTIEVPAEILVEDGDDA